MGSHLWGVSVTGRIEHCTGELQLVQHSVCSDVFVTFPHPGGLWRLFLSLCYAPGVPICCLEHASWPRPKLCQKWAGKECEQPLTHQLLWPCLCLKQCVGADPEKGLSPQLKTAFGPNSFFKYCIKYLSFVSGMLCEAKEKLMTHAAFGFLWQF